MRISPNHPRLRIVAFACWALGAYCLVHGGFLSLNATTLLVLTVSTQLLGMILLALGVAFWLLSADQRAGVVFDGKGLLLNLGSSSSFIAWENIERVGVSAHRSHLLSLGSARQFGIALKHSERYVQSYEERLPAASGPFASALRAIDVLLRPFRAVSDRPLIQQLEQNRERTGFDVLIPETFLGGHADTFAQLVEAYRSHASRRHSGEQLHWAR